MLEKDQQEHQQRLEAIDRRDDAVTRKTRRPSKTEAPTMKRLVSPASAIVERPLRRSISCADVALMPG